MTVRKRPSPALVVALLALFVSHGRVVARGLWSGARTRRLSFVVCGQRRLALRVTSAGKPGRFDLTLARP